MCVGQPSRMRCGLRLAAVEVFPPVAPNGVRRNAAVFFAGQLTSTGCVWLLVVALARVGGPEPVGVFTFALALAAPAVVASQLGLRQVLNTDIRNRFRFEDFRLLRIALSFIAVIAIGTIGFALEYAGETLTVICLVGLAKALDSVGDIYHALLQRGGRLDRAGVSLALRGVLLLVFGGTGFALTGSVVVLAGAMAVASGIALGGYDHPVTTRTMVSPRQKRSGAGRRLAISRRLVLQAAPLGVSAVLVSLNFNAPRYAVESWMGPVGLGHYAAMDNIAAIGLLAVQAVGQALFPVSRRAGRQLTTEASCGWARST